MAVGDALDTVEDLVRLTRNYQAKLDISSFLVAAQQKSLADEANVHLLSSGLTAQALSPDFLSEDN